MDKIIDITATINSRLVLWPGHPRLQLRKMLDIEKGDVGNVTVCSFCAHIGTHVDSPRHFYSDGEGIEGVHFEGLVGKAYVADLTHIEKCINPEDLQFINNRNDFSILLMRTKNSTTKTTWEQFDPTYIYLTPEGADFVVESGLKGIAIDCLGINGYEDAEQKTHKILLRDNKVVVVEGVDLRNVSPGNYLFICLPIKLEGADGAPARAILIESSSFDMK